MTAKCDLAIAGPALLDIAKRSGDTNSAGCEALLELVNASDRLRSQLRHELSMAKLSHTGFNILALVHMNGDEPIGTGGIAEHLELSAQTVSAALARLEMAGLVTLTRQPENRRRINVRLTDAGTNTILSALERIETGVARLMHPLSPEELQNLKSVCSSLALSPETLNS